MGLTNVFITARLAGNLIFMREELSSGKLIENAYFLILHCFRCKPARYANMLQLRGVNWQD